MPTTEQPRLTRAAEARLRSPRARGAFRPIDAARRQLGLLQVSDGAGQAALSWLIDLEAQRVAEARFLAFGSRWSHPIADAFTQLARGMTVAEACAIRPDTVEAMLRDEPGTPSCTAEELAFIPDLQRRAAAVLPLVKLLPKPAEKQVYQRKRQQDWTPEDAAWLPLSLIRKARAVEPILAAVIGEKAPAATFKLEGIHDDLRVVVILGAVDASAKATLAMFLGDALRRLHPGISVETP